MLRLTFIYSGSSGFCMCDFCGRKNAHTEHSGPAASAFALLFFPQETVCTLNAFVPANSVIMKRSAINSSFSEKKIVFQPDSVECTLLIEYFPSNCRPNSLQLFFVSFADSRISFNTISTCPTLMRLD